MERYHSFEIESCVGDFPVEPEQTPNVPGSQRGPEVAQRTLGYEIFTAV